MSTLPLHDDQQPVDPGSQSAQEQSLGVSGSTSEQPPAHGATGEGAGSAMAQLISQEQARVVPGSPDDAPTGGS